MLLRMSNWYLLLHMCNWLCWVLCLLQQMPQKLVQLKRFFVYFPFLLFFFFQDLNQNPQIIEWQIEKWKEFLGNYFVRQFTLSLPSRYNIYKNVLRKIKKFKNFSNQDWWIFKISFCSYTSQHKDTLEFRMTWKINWMQHWHLEWVTSFCCSVTWQLLLFLQTRSRHNSLSFNTHNV